MKHRLFKRMTSAALSAAILFSAVSLTPLMEANAKEYPTFIRQFYENHEPGFFYYRGQPYDTRNMTVPLDKGEFRYEPKTKTLHIHPHASTIILSNPNDEYDRNRFLVDNDGIDGLTIIFDEPLTVYTYCDNFVIGANADTTTKTNGKLNIQNVSYLTEAEKENPDWRRMENGVGRSAAIYALDPSDLTIQDADIEISAYAGITTYFRYDNNGMGPVSCYKKSQLNIINSTLKINCEREAIDLFTNGISLYNSHFQTPEDARIVDYTGPSASYRNISNGMSDTYSYITSNDQTVSSQRIRDDISKSLEIVPNLPTDGVQVFGTSLSLDSDIDVNIYAYISNPETFKKAELTGPNGTKIIDYLPDLEYYHKQDNGSYKFSYPINATQMNQPIKLTIYGEDDSPLDIYNSKAELLPDKTITVSAMEYLDNAQKNRLWNPEKHAALDDLAEIVKTYGMVSSAYFKGGDLPYVSDRSRQINAVSTEGTPVFEPSFTSEQATLSLMLNSKLAAHLYIKDLPENAEAQYNGKVLKAQKAADNRYYFKIDNIRPTAFNQTHTITYNGTDYTFSALSWAYRVMQADSAAEEDVAMANILYQYYDNACKYANAGDVWEWKDSRPNW